jgi:hypothetical protein
LTANIYRGEFPFDYFVGAEGYESIEPGDFVLRFRSGDLAKLQADLVPMTFTEISKAIVECDAKVIFAALKHGLKSNNPERPVIVNKPMLDDLPFALGTVRGTIDDAFLWVWTGKTRADLAAALLGDKSADAGEDHGEDGGSETPFGDSTTSPA